MDKPRFMTYLEALMSGLSLPVTTHQKEQVFTYLTLMLEHNKNINLTAITDQDEMVLKHFVDSILPLTTDKKLDNLIDIGTGAGLPGIPLAIMCPDVKVTLLDPLKKRIAFLDEVVIRLGLKNVTTLAERSEDAGQHEKHREVYTTVVSRGVAPIHKLVEYCLPFVAVGGTFIAYKSQKAQEELLEGEKAIATLGGRLKEVIQIDLPDTEDVRNLIFIEKVSACDKKYPRKPNQIKNKPLL